MNDLNPIKIQLARLIHTIGLFCLLLTTSQVVGQADISLSMTSSASEVIIGDTVSFDLLVTNEGEGFTSLQIDHSISNGNTFLNANAPTGLTAIYDSTASRWVISNFPADSAITLSLDFLIQSSGEIKSIADVFSSAPQDSDASPGNNDFSEDDFAVACTSVPIVSNCTFFSLDLDVADGFGPYTWYKDGEILPELTDHELTITEAGNYTVSSTNGGPSVDIVCPIIFEQDCSGILDTLDINFTNQTTTHIDFSTYIDLPSPISSTIVAGNTNLNAQLLGDSLEFDATGYVGLDTFIIEHTNTEFNISDTTWIPIFIKPSKGNDTIVRQVTTTDTTILLSSLEFGGSFTNQSNCNEPDQIISFVAESGSIDLGIRPVDAKRDTLQIDNLVLNYGQTDSICQTFCYSLADTSFCDTVLFTTYNAPPSDTIRLTVEKIDTIVNSICIADSFLQAGTLSTVSVLDSGSHESVLLTAITDNCLDIKIDSAFEGSAVEPIVAVHCNDFYCDTSTILIEVLVSVNEIQTIRDEYIMPVGSLLRGNFIANDFDRSGKAFEHTSNTTPKFGQFNYEGNGYFNYRPSQIGIDTFSYTVCNTEAPSVCQTNEVILHAIDSISSPFVSIDDYVFTTRDAVDTIFVLQNDLLDKASTVNLINSATAVNTVVSENKLIITSDTAFIGIDTVFYSVCNDDLCDTASVFIQVDSTELQQDIAQHDYFSTIVGLQLNQKLELNDRVGSANEFSLLTEPINGTVQIQEDGSFSYQSTTNTNFDYFQYKVCESADPSICATAFAYIFLEQDSLATQPPLAVTDFVILKANDSQTIDVLQNDLDEEPDLLVLQANLVQEPNLVTQQIVEGELVLQAGGSKGRDTILYLVCDNDLVPNCDTGLVIIDVINPKDTELPIAIHDNYTLSVNDTATLSFLTNDLAAKDIALTVTVNTDDTKGTAILNPSNQLIYQPIQDFEGRDLVRYTICNQLDESKCANGLIFINIYENSIDRVITQPDYLFVDMGDTIDFDVLINDYHSNGNRLTADSIIQQPANGTVSLDTLGLLTYTPNQGFDGVDSVQYLVCGAGEPAICQTERVFITVVTSFTRDTISLNETNETSFCLDLSDFANEPTINVIEKSSDNIIVQNGSCFSYTSIGLADRAVDTITIVTCELQNCDTTMYLIQRINFACSSIFDQDTLEVQSNCDGAQTICLEQNSLDLANYQLYFDSAAFNIAPSDCQETTGNLSVLENRLNETDTFELIWMFEADTFSSKIQTTIELLTFFETIATDTDWHLVGDSLFAETSSSLSPFYLINAAKDTFIHTFNTETLATGIELELTESIHQLKVVEPTSGCMDSICIKPLCIVDTFTVKVAKGGIRQICVSDFGINNSLVSLRNICDDQTSGVAFATYDLANGCLRLEGLVAQTTDFICLEACDEAGCYVIPIAIEVVDECVDFLIRNTAIVANDRCPSEMEACIPFPFDSIGQRYSLTYFADNSAVDGISQGLCEAPTGGNGINLNIPQGQTDLLITREEDGCQDTMILLYSCAIQDFQFINSGINAVDTVCIDTDELPGRLTRIENYCADQSSESAVFNVLEDSYCVEVNSFEKGESYACIVVCDEFGLCDTTILAARISDLDSIIANPDTITTTENQPITLDVSQNDTIDDVSSIRLLSLPASLGELNRNQDFSLTFIPGQDLCSDTEVDSFQYEICNFSGLCDIATGIIRIPCNGLQIMNGFSPNDDGLNDAFVIEGIQAYPNTFLSIYNRLGNLVYQTENYQNDWKGTFDDVALPAGTYFYSLDLGEGSVLSGYVQIQR